MLHIETNVTDAAPMLRVLPRQPALRLGSAEHAILTELRSIGEPVPRRQLLSTAIGASLSRETGRSRSAGDVDARFLSGRRRQNAESTLSRALRSLERKGLIVRVLIRPAKQTLVAACDPPSAPAWEQAARAQEAYADRCEAVSAELIELARTARAEASRLRTAMA